MIIRKFFAVEKGQAPNWWSWGTGQIQYKAGRYEMDVNMGCRGFQAPVVSSIEQPDGRLYTITTIIPHRYGSAGDVLMLFFLMDIPETFDHLVVDGSRIKMFFGLENE